MISRLEVVLQRFGFDPLETPAFERMEVLTGGQESTMALYTADVFSERRKSEIQEQHRIGLRFDLTVPLARFVAANPNIPKPFKRYQMGSVWRAESPQAGRFNEFMQFDFDSVGTSSLQADAEIVWCMYEGMRALGIERFLIRVNNRKVLSGLSDLIAFDPARINDLLRVLDKLEKVGRIGVRTELQIPQEENFDSLAFSDAEIEQLFVFLNLEGSGDALLEKARRLFPSNSIAQEGLEELASISSILRGVGIPEENWIIDFSVARGLGYYTGPVFETTLLDMPKIGSVCSGGRYDGLVSRFIETKMPATGASFGVDRLFEALDRLGLVEKKQTNLQVIVLPLDIRFMEVYNQMLQQLRVAGVRASLYLGDEQSFSGQFRAAVKLGAPILIIMGSDEVDRGVVKIKDTRTRQQVEKPRDELIVAISGLLAR